MKIKIIILAFITTLGFSSCEDKLGEVADFASTSKGPYVELTTKTAQTAKQGATITVAFRSRENFQQPVTITYAITGAYTATGTGTLARNTLAGTFSVTIPANAIPVGSTTASAVLTLKTAVMGTQNLSIGYLDPAAEKKTINITL